MDEMRSQGPWVESEPLRLTYTDESGWDRMNYWYIIDRQGLTKGPFSQSQARQFLRSLRKAGVTSLRKKKPEPTLAPVTPVEPARSTSTIVDMWRDLRAAGWDAHLTYHAVREGEGYVMKATIEAGNG